MSVLTSLRFQIDGLVHASAQSCPAERARHRTFLVGRLASSFAILAILPPYLTYRGLPAGWEAMAFVWLLLPLVGVAIVTRTGQLAWGQAVCLASLVGVVVTTSMGGGAHAAALAWLIVVPLEAALGDRVFLIFAATAAALVAALLLAARTGAGDAALDHSLLSQAAFVIPAIAYAGGLAFAVRYLADVQRNAQAVGSARHRSLVAALGNMILVFDRSGNVLSCDQGMQQLVGVPPHEVRGTGLFDRINVADRPVFLKALADACDASGPAVVAVRLRLGPDDFHSGRFEATSFGWVELRLCRAESRAPGGATVCVAVARDIGDAKGREHDLQAARGEAERTIAWKDRFLANVSHELRTPLNAIIGFAEMLESPDLTPRDPAKQREYAGIIKTSGEHLLAVVNGILDMSKIEAGSFDILPEPFDVVPLIDASCDIVRLKAEQCGIEIVKACEPRLPDIVADKRACRQILINLLSNAVKFTPRNGRVTVGARLDGGTMELFVQDNGIGIAQGDLPRLGSPFFQVHADNDRHYEGTGLGLSVVRGLVGLHRGSIAIESAPGEGTNVCVRLPLDCRPSAKAGPSVARIETAHRKPPADPASGSSLQRRDKKIA